MDLSLDTLENLLGSGEIQEVEDNALVGAEELAAILTVSSIILLLTDVRFRSLIHIQPISLLTWQF